MSSAESWALPSRPDLSISSGIDWLSCSQVRCDELPSLFDAASARQLQNAERGDFAKPWASHGLCGTICGDTVAARSDLYEFASVSSAGATEAFPVLFPLCTNVSRLDLQITATYEHGGVRSVAKGVYGARADAARGGRPTSRTLLTGTNGSATCYVGSRRSDLFGRVYDKGVESRSGPPGASWRFEVELKRGRAALTAKELSQVESLASEAAAIVCGAFSAWGVRFPSTWPASLSPQIVEEDSDAVVSLAWLRTGVSPTVRRLLSMGMLSEVLSALGLPPR